MHRKSKLIYGNTQYLRYFLIGWVDRIKIQGFVPIAHYVNILKINLGIKLL
jgi:hypothetical protein